MSNLKPAAEKMRLELLAVEEAEGAAEKAHDEAAAAAKAAGQVGEIVKTLQEKAVADLNAGEHFEPVVVEAEEGDLEGWAEGMVTLLLPAHQEDLAKVKAHGIGICATCRWKSGCKNCYWPKTVRYWRNLELRGKHLEGYSDAVKAKAKAKAKAKGKAKAEGKAKAKGKAKAAAKAKLLGGGSLQTVAARQKKVCSICGLCSGEAVVRVQRVWVHSFV
jgi:hypothetical protein